MPSVEPIIAFDHVTKRYGRRPAVDDVSFAVPAGGVVGLVGPNGAGKTTAIRMLLGLVRPTAGAVRLFGTAPASARYAAALRQVGAMVEGPALYRNASARANLRIQAAALGVPDDRGHEDDLLDLVGLAGRGDDRVRSFSLGMRQRLGIAIALVGSPRLLVLDEPTNGLDPAGIVEIRALLRGLAERGVTVVVSSHLLGELELMADSVVVMHRGRLVVHLPLDRLLDGAGGLERAFLALTQEIT